MKHFFKKLVILLLLILFLYVFYQFIFIRFHNKIKLEKDSIAFRESIQNSPFSVSKMMLYSSVSGQNQNTTFQQNSWVLNLLQYSDIAIYLSHSGETLQASNTVQKLWLEDIQFSAPQLGTPSLYYLDSLHFGTASFLEINQLANTLEFTVLNDENKNHAIGSNTPVFFTDCSNPITLKYVNPSVKENYTIITKEPIFFDGRLLQLANVPLEDLDAKLKFTIHLQSNDNKNYFYNVVLPIPLKNETSSIYEGSILVETQLENAKLIEKNP